MDGRCPRCGAFVSESSRFCRECLLQLAPGEDLGGGQTALLRRAWEREHPEATQAFAAWAAAPEGPPPGVSSPVVQHEAEPEHALGEWKPLDRRLLLVTVALAALVTIDLAQIASRVMENGLFERIRDGDAVTQSEFDSNDLRVALLLVVWGTLLLSILVLFIMWFHRAYQNVDALRTRVRRHGTGWAIGGWFVPILAFFRPKEIANDLWASGTPEGEDRSPPWWLLAWWLSLIAWGFMVEFASRIDIQEGPDAVIRANNWFIASHVLEIVGAILAIGVARRITKRLKARREEAVSPPSPAAELPA